VRGGSLTVCPGTIATVGKRYGGPYPAICEAKASGSLPAKPLGRIVSDLLPS